MRLIPTALTQRNVDPNDPTSGQTIDALMARQRSLTQNQPEAPAQIASPWQGAAFMANSFTNALQQKQAQDQEAAGRQKLAQTMAGIDYNTGATPEQIATMASLDPDTANRMMADAVAARREAAATAAANAEWERRNKITNEQELEKTRLTTGAAAGGKAFSNEQDLRKEYSALPVIKNLPIIQNAVERISTGKSVDNAVGDMAIVYGFMKLQDPDSAVREGEYATAENARGVPATIQNLYNRAVNGERLTPEQRQNFLDLSIKQYQSYAGQVKATNDRFTPIAAQWQIDPSRVLVQPPAFDVATPTPDPNAPNAPTDQNAPAIPDKPTEPPAKAPDDVRAFKANTWYVDDKGNVAYYTGGPVDDPANWKNMQKAVP